MKLKNAIWFSRHYPTNEQIRDAADLGYKIVDAHAGKSIGDIQMLSIDDSHLVCGLIGANAKKHDAQAIFGVFPPPVMEQTSWPSDTDTTVPMFSSWTITPPTEDGSATFKHLKWCEVGAIDLGRWV